MNILGLNFGHDAAVAVLRDGRVTAYVLRERHARIKHAMTLDMNANALKAAFSEFGADVSLEEISDAPERAARDLAADKVIGWFEGRSEIGDRALGRASRDHPQ